MLYAHVDQGHVSTVRVTSPGFVAQHPSMYPGVWVWVDGEAARPAPEWGYSDNLEELFAPVWSQPGSETGGLPEGAVRWHNSRLWVSTVGNNVWEPGVSGWHDSPTGGWPQWIQPTGGHDAYDADVIVQHDGQVWINVHGDGNVWEPGVYGWEVHDG